MRRLLVSTLVSLACGVPALAQGVPQDQAVAPKAAQETIAPKASRDTVGPKTAQDEDNIVSELVRSIERSVQTRLVRAGFTDIQMVPTSFLVRAKNPDGQTVMLELSPDSVAELQETPSGQPDDSSEKDGPSGQPSTRIPGPDGAR